MKKQYTQSAVDSVPKDLRRHQHVRFSSIAMALFNSHIVTPATINIWSDEELRKVCERLRSKNLFCAVENQRLAAGYLTTWDDSIYNRVSFRIETYSDLVFSGKLSMRAVVCYKDDKFNSFVDNLVQSRNKQNKSQASLDPTSFANKENIAPRRG